MDRAVSGHPGLRRRLAGWDGDRARNGRRLSFKCCGRCRSINGVETCNRDARRALTVVGRPPSALFGASSEANSSLLAAQRCATQSRANRSRRLVPVISEFEGASAGLTCCEIHIRSIRGCRKQKNAFARPAQVLFPCSNNRSINGSLPPKNGR